MAIQFNTSEGWINEPREDFAEGVYGAVISSAEENKNGNLALKLKVTDAGDYEGATITKTLGLDFSKRGNQAGFATMLVATGMKRDKALGSGTIDPDKHLKGKKLHFYTRPKQGDEKYAPIDLLPPEVVEDMRARFAGGDASDTTDDAETVAAPVKGKAAANGKAPAAAAADDSDPFA